MGQSLADGSALNDKGAFEFSSDEEDDGQRKASGKDDIIFCMCVLQVVEVL